MMAAEEAVIQLEAGDEDAQTAEARIDAQLEKLKKKDCAESLSCKVSKKQKAHELKAKKGLFGKRKVNVKQMDGEKKKMDKTKARMKEVYQKLLKGTLKDKKKK